jgi:hypothetical protein
METPANTALRAVTLPVTGFAAIVKLSVARMLATFDPPADIETRIDLVPPEESEPPQIE